MVAVECLHKTYTTLSVLTRHNLPPTVKSIIGAKWFTDKKKYIPHHYVSEFKNLQIYKIDPRNSDNLWNPDLRNRLIKIFNDHGYYACHHFKVCICRGADQ